MQTTNAPKTLGLTVREAARYLGISERTLWSGPIASGKLKLTRISARRRIITHAELARFVANATR